ncbi:DTL [Acanthosepion pharaonis]|uniref:Small ribosomal subunit protein uS14 n=1 Tax=Acanthosepion pharaonis TaxID=158019 RepID=A0A812CSU2_ACAPH|nr:DTL [Sepia pharaonis]
MVLLHYLTQTFLGRNLCSEIGMPMTRTHLTWRSNSTKNSLLSLDRHKSVTSVLFHTDHLIVSAGAVNNHIKVWDLRKCSSLQLNPTPVQTFSSFQNAVRNHGITNLVFDSSYTKLFASCKDNKIYQYDFASYSPRPVKIFQGFENASFYIKSSISPCDQYLISGSHDNTAYIWDIATLSDDNTLRLWRIQRNRRLIEKDSNWGTACKYNIPFCDHPVILSPSFSDLTNERPFPVTPDPQKPSQSSSPPLSLVGWLKTNAYPKNKSCHSANKKHHPKTPNSSRKTPHKSSPVVMSGKHSLHSFQSCGLSFQSESTLGGYETKNRMCILWDRQRFGPGSRQCRVCANTHGVIRKYSLFMCRRCFRDYSNDIGFKKLD